MWAVCSEFVLFSPKSRNLFGMEATKFMKKLDISSIIYYGRSYCNGDVGYFLNLDSLILYSRESLVDEYSFTDEILSDIELLCNTYRFAPIFQVDIIEKMRFFLNNLNNRRISKEIMELNPEQLYVYFQKHIELNFGDHQRWREYEKQFLTSAAIEWCKSLHIPYNV